jgi:hypothetical protein
LSGKISCATVIPVTDLRTWWWHRQGLDGSLADASPAEVLAGSGWARSVGGANPYLTLFARTGVSRAEVDAAVAELAIHELPSARGCTYVVPASDFALALQVGRGAPEAEVATAARLGVPRAELDALCAAVLDAVAGGPLDPAALRGLLGDAVRNLGPAGRKAGLSTTLPVALGLLQAEGELRRVPVDGRLDQQRYAYARWTPPVSGLTDEQARVELVRRYLGWTGGATVGHIRWFTAFSARDTKAALAAIEPADLGGGVLALPEDATAYAEFRPPAGPSYSLVAGIDAILMLRRDLPSVLDPGDAARIGLGSAKDLPDHAIIDRGRVVGLWQYDVDGQRVAWWAFGGADPALREVVARTEAYIRDQLGDARSFSLDSPASRAPRIATLDQATTSASAKPS